MNNKMKNEIVISADFLECLKSMCEPEIIEPCMKWLKVVITDSTNFWDCTDFLTNNIQGVERVDKIQLVSLFMSKGKIVFLADFCNYIVPSDLWNEMRNLKLIEENEYRFLIDTWEPNNMITKANL